MVALTIDGRRIEVPEDTSLLAACLQAGSEVPHLCHQEGILPYGACRVCTVEVTQGGRTKLMASCSHRVTEGLEVRTDTERVQEGRRIVLELLLARCPEVEELRELARRWGVAESRFESRKKDDCILCGLCVRACSEVVGAEVLGFTGRGTSRELARPLAYDPETCIGCGLCTYVCPTGAIQMEADKVEALRRAAGTERTCRYMLMGLVSAKTCPENFECWHCPYDQLMEATLGTHPALALRPARGDDPVQVGPFELLPDRSYAPNHLWLRDLDGLWLLGVDALLAGLMSPLDDVEVSGEAVRLVTSAGALSLGLPLPAKLVKINQDVRDVPRLVNFSPYERGWLAILEPANGKPVGLLEGQAAAHWLRAEVERLAQAVGLAADELTVSAARERRGELAATFVATAEQAGMRSAGGPEDRA